MVHCQHDLGNQSRCHCFDKARARANDSGVFRFGSNHETGNILDKKQRRLTSVAGFDEVGHLLGRLCIDDAAETWRTAAGRANHAAIVGNHSDLNAANTRVARDHLLRVVCLKLVEMSVIEQAVQQVRGRCKAVYDLPE